MNSLSLFLTLCLIFHSFFLTAQVAQKPSNTALKKPSMKQKIVIRAQKIAAEVNATPSMKDWINKAPRNLKSLRQRFFGSKFNSALPKAIPAPNAVAFVFSDKKLKPVVIKLKPRGQQIHYFLGKKDITRRKNEPMATWLRRCFPKTKFARSLEFHPLLSIWAAKAYAQTNVENNGLLRGTPLEVAGATSFWSGILGSMTAEEWQNTDVVQNYMHDGRQLVDAAQYLAQDPPQGAGLSCYRGEAWFQFRFDSVLADHQSAQVGAPSGYVHYRTSFDHSKNLSRIRLERGESSSGLRSGSLGSVAYGTNSSGTPTTAYISDSSVGSVANPQSFDSQWFSQNFAKMLLRTPSNNDPNTGNIDPTLYEAEMQLFQVTADFARACCSNKKCLEDANLFENGDAHGTPSNR